MRHLKLPEIETVAGAGINSQGWNVMSGRSLLNRGRHIWRSGAAPDLGGASDQGWDSGGEEAEDEQSGIENYLTDQELCIWEEHNVDSIAEIAAGHIMSQPDWNEREYGYIIYRDADGDFRTGPMEIGQTVDENGGQYASAVLSITPDMRNGEILGFIHNHPTDGYNNEEDLDNRNPSASDWDAFHELKNNFGAVDDLSMYILGPDGVLREFHASDESRHTAENNPSAPDWRNDVRNGLC